MTRHHFSGIAGLGRGLRVLFFFNLNFYFYFILLYNTVLVLPYIDMNPEPSFPGKLVTV